MAGLDLSQYKFAGGAPLSALNYSGSSTENGNPFKNNSQEYSEYNNYYNQKTNPVSTAVAAQPAPDYAAIAAQQLKLRQDANAPAVQSLQASIPEIANKYTQTQTQLEGERQPLKDRYKAVLDQLSAKENGQVTAAVNTTNQNYGERGLAGGVLDHAIQGAVNPIQQYYSAQSAGVNADQESQLQSLNNLIAKLPTQQTEEQRAVQNAIAQLQAGGAGEAINNALTLYQTQLGNQTNNAELALKQAGLNQAQQLQDYNINSSKQTDPVQLAMLQAQLQATQDKNKSTNFDWAKYGL